jgi:regulator of protease activity HflC (stomatin/prohibitin superfamily)
MLKVIVASLAVASLTGCVKSISTDPSTETVLVDKPWIFGHGGVRPETQRPGLGWFFWSTSGIHVPTYEFKIDEPFDDLPTKFQSFIDFNSYLKLEITDRVKLVKDFRYIDDGKDLWYHAALKEQYRTIVRNVARNYKMEDMLTDSQVVQAMETEIRNNVDALIASIGIPVKLKDLSLGAIRPNQSVMSEIDSTAANQQRIKTEMAREQAEISRKAAELARASADKAYQDELKLTSDDIVKLQIAKMYSDACAKSATCVLSTADTSVAVKAR